MISAIAREEARRYNREYDVFEAYSHTTGESRFYDHYGVAYRYSIERVRRGEEVISILGTKWVDDPSDQYGGDFVTEELMSF